MITYDGRAKTYGRFLPSLTLLPRGRQSPCSNTRAHARRNCAEQRRVERFARRRALLSFWTVERCKRKEEEK